LIKSVFISGAALMCLTVHLKHLTITSVFFGVDSRVDLLTEQAYRLLMTTVLGHISYVCFTRWVCSM